MIAAVCVAIFSSATAIRVKTANCSSEGVSRMCSFIGLLIRVVVVAAMGGYLLVENTCVQLFGCSS